MKELIPLLALLGCLTLVWAARYPNSGGPYGSYGPYERNTPKYYGLTFGGKKSARGSSNGNWDSDLLDQRVSKQRSARTGYDREGGASLNGDTWAWGGRGRRMRQKTGSGAYDTWLGAARGKYDSDYMESGERGGIWDR